MRLNKKVFVGIIILIFLFFPSFTVYENAYQKNLWTSHNLSNRSETNDIVLKIGGEFKEIKNWKRLRLGIPTKAMTFDFQYETRIWQGRLEIKYLLINLIFAGLLILFIWFGEILWRNLK